jgi:hypothetical protein
MAKYEFTLILSGSPELTEEAAERLFAAGCDDGTPGTCNGVFSIDFHRQAPSLEEAICSALTNVKSAGYEVERVEIEAEAVAAYVYYENTGGKVKPPL